MLGYPSQCQSKILECKGKVCDSDSNCRDVGLCDVSSGAQRTLGQNHQKSMLACILQNLTGQILLSVYSISYTTYWDTLHITTYVLINSW